MIKTYRDAFERDSGGPQPVKKLENDITALMHTTTANAFKAVLTTIREDDLDVTEIIELIETIIEEQEAQVIVVKLRNEL